MFVIMLEYSSFIIFIIFSIILSAIIPAASFALGIKKLDDEKASVFECGFSP
jgi:NADH:ubiquinone oxidoreductase subunit 3 (subunit A)